ncbi:MAG: GHKL domain-containing protein [Bacteroidetes bacterium]|nr:GHKL domain-containing protein [Bacteroidota bacterium]
MNKSRKNGYISIFTGLVLIAIGQVFLVRNQNLGPEIVLNREARIISNELNATKRVIDEIHPKLKADKNGNYDSAMMRRLRNAGVDVFVYRDNQPLFWTTNSYNVSPMSGHGSGVQIQKNASRYVVIWSVFQDTMEYLFGKEIIRNPEFRFLNSATLQEERQNKFELSANPIENSIPILANGMPLFHLVIVQYKPGIGMDLLIVFGVLLISLGIYYFVRKTKFWYLFYLITLFQWLILEFLFYKNFTLWNLKQTGLFAPEVYASSWYFPNLGILLFNTLFGFLTANYIWTLLKRFGIGNAPLQAVLISLMPTFCLALIVGFQPLTQAVGGIMFFLIWLLLTAGIYFLVKWVQGRSAMGKVWCMALLRFIFLLLILAFSVVFISETGKLVRDSSIIFDFHEIHLISIFTVLGLIGVAMGVGILLRLIQALHMLRNSDKWAWVHLVAVIFAAGWIFLEHQKVEAVLLLFLSGSLLALEFFVKGARPWWYYGLKIVIPCLIVGSIFNRYVGQKEIELREILAAKLLLQSEREPTNLLIKTETQLKRDKGIVDYYTCTDVSKSDFEKRLRQLYFSEYSEDYEMLVFDYNLFGGNYRQENVFDYVSINGLYLSEACKPVTKNFYLVNERKLKGSFLGKFPVVDSGNFYGTYFVLLKPRISASQGRLSDVFHKSPLEVLFTDNRYSYAFYSQNRLSRRYGQYNYPNNFKFKKLTSTQELNGFSHFNYSDDLGNIIVISKPIKSWLQELTVYTILVLGCLVTALLYLLVVLGRQYLLSVGKRDFTRLRLIQVLKNRIPLNSGSSLFLSSKLQLYVILVVFATFLVVLYVTINYFKNSYTQRQREFLWNKTNEIANTIGTQTNLDALFNKNQTGLVYDLSNYYSTDINIYNANGKLLVSSNDRIYDQDIIGALMNPTAFRNFNDQGISGFIQDEAIGDLNYISAYYTIFDNDLNVKGYLNLPYFTNRQDLFREISNYATTVINLFALVFALAALVAYVIAHRITEPLNLIRRQMGLVKLGARNAPILWQHNDEIGLLIAEYNKMIEALEESSNKLAEGERQGAWREMAKQVAHEIKNPLTPMKLSLQHLQYAMQKKDANIEEKIKKTSELLIKQIDSLSRMAEEFSAFAKMPEAKSEDVVLNEILDEAVQLFEKEENVTMHYTPLQTKVKVHVDAHQITRVFTNILKNAIQAIPEDRKGLIKVRMQVSDGKVAVYFEDNGKGIPEELQKKIFSPNFSTKNSGMGLGLAISRRMVEQFSGTIDFQSKPDKGSTFFVTLPVVLN